MTAQANLGKVVRLHFDELDPVMDYPPCHAAYQSTRPRCSLYHSETGRTTIRSPSPVKENKPSDPPPWKPVLNVSSSSGGREQLPQRKHFMTGGTSRMDPTSARERVHPLATDNSKRECLLTSFSTQKMLR